MSVENAKAFIEKMKSDEAFRAHILAIENVEEYMAAAINASFIFTEAEMQQVQSEFTDEDLDDMAGWLFKWNHIFDEPD
ncbi:MAG: Nif11-like leader peptide family RiPP precursor [Chlorobiales bacterium]|nr:Nif11-like leader peptide family RiPP precursor [Chlorobiales bacterium]